MRKNDGKVRLSVSDRESLAACRPLITTPTDSNQSIDLLTVAEVAEVLKVSSATIRRLQQGRRIPFYRIGGGVRFARNDLVTYLQQNLVGTVG